MLFHVQGQPVHFHGKKAQTTTQFCSKLGGPRVYLCCTRKKASVSHLFARIRATSSRQFLQIKDVDLSSGNSCDGCVFSHQKQTVENNHSQGVPPSAGVVCAMGMLTVLRTLSCREPHTPNSCASICSVYSVSPCGLSLCNRCEFTPFVEPYSYRPTDSCTWG